MAQWCPLRIFKIPDDDVFIYMGFSQPALHFTDSCAVPCASAGARARAQSSLLAALIVFKSLNGLVPPYISELLHSYNPARCLRSADQLLLEVPRAKRKLRGDRAFSAVGPKLWNDLPLHIRQAPSLSIFKTCLKTHFYSLAFNPA